ncbi:nucleotidyltransferase [Wansuia hejianensis]|uniref:tRNA(Met) cytidine acetate ligase n=1 Tax=Wansuia hejianensis TaxID=2763667 RepID=A0A926ILT0_9FIRM|nr:nucleotidyltransferase [Wansuia hejianensis]MBC8590474.1 nucleotidyltransferase [Wansuia hejianensis]
MKVVGLITEYNPFHFGHKYHLNKSMNLTGATHSVAIMSSSFVQRGEPSLVDKWTKAKMAIDNGVDLVIELPFVYSCQSAELFAYGAISILDAMGIIDYISFGSESGDLQSLSMISQILLDEPLPYKEYLKSYLSKGLSYPVSRSLALGEYLKSNKSMSSYSSMNILKQSNNILGIEYLKAIYSLNSKIKPFTIQRKGANYNDQEIHSGFASATAIRKCILDNGISSIIDLIPEESYNRLQEYESKYKVFNSLDNYTLIIKYLLLLKDKNQLNNILDIENGLENRIIEKSSLYNSIEKIVGAITTKRYPITRIQRILIHLLNNLDGNTIRELYSYVPQYIRILGANKKGLELLKLIKENSNLSIITKFADYHKLDNKVINKFLDFEQMSTDIFFLGLGLNESLVKMDYYISPYIK